MARAILEPEEQSTWAISRLPMYILSPISPFELHFLR